MACMSCIVTRFCYSHYYCFNCPFSKSGTFRILSTNFLGMHDWLLPAIVAHCAQEVTACGLWTPSPLAKDQVCHYISAEEGRDHTVDPTRLPHEKSPSLVKGDPSHSVGSPRGPGSTNTHLKHQDGLAGKL